MWMPLEFARFQSCNGRVLIVSRTSIRINVERTDVKYTLRIKMFPMMGRSEYLWMVSQLMTSLNLQWAEFKFHPHLY